jgi:hypothetical protein
MISIISLHPFPSKEIREPAIINEQNISPYAALQA